MLLGLQILLISGVKCSYYVNFFASILGRFRGQETAISIVSAVVLVLIGRENKTYYYYYYYYYYY